MVASSSVDVSATTASVELGFKQPSSEKHAKDVIRVEFFFLVLLSVPLLEILLCAMLVVDLALIRVAKTSKCL